MLTSTLGQGLRWETGPQPPQPDTRAQRRAREHKNASRTVFTFARRARRGGKRLPSRLREAESCAARASRSRSGARRLALPSFLCPGAPDTEQRTPSTPHSHRLAPSPQKLNFQNFPAPAVLLNFKVSRAPSRRRGRRRDSATLPSLFINPYFFRLLFFLFLVFGWWGASERRRGGEGEAKLFPAQPHEGQEARRAPPPHPWPCASPPTPAGAPPGSTVRGAPRGRTAAAAPPRRRTERRGLGGGVRASPSGRQAAHKGET